MFHFSPKTHRNISRIIPFGAIWLFTGWVFLLVEAAATRSPMDVPDSAIQLDFRIFIFSSVAIFLFGLMIGTIEMIFLENLFRNKRFITKILYKLDLYIFLLLLVICITFPIAASLEAGLPLFHPQIWERFKGFLFSYTFLSTLLQMAFSLFLCLLYAGISENLGHAVLVNFFTGKYHQPLEEKRIFMFLDMKSSTTFAEQLGHIQYFDLLQDYYNDLSASIINYWGEVYQYVGDEVVVSWPVSRGLENNNCIRSFFAMKGDLLKKADHYLEKYGVVPTFKAGAHLGYVTTGEIGSLKKEIIFTGDVLNVTSRIQGLCNAYKEELLVSEYLSVSLSPTSDFELAPVDTANLAGRKERKKLFAVRQLNGEKTY